MSCLLRGTQKAKTKKKPKQTKKKAKTLDIRAMFRRQREARFKRQISRRKLLFQTNIVLYLLVWFIIFYLRKKNLHTQHYIVFSLYANYGTQIIYKCKLSRKGLKFTNVSPIKVTILYGLYVSLKCFSDQFMCFTFRTHT